MADPYSAAAVNASASSLPQAPPSLPSGWAATPGLSTSDSSPDYLFETDYDESFRRSWGERLTFHAGSAYLLGTPAAWHPPLQRASQMGNMPASTCTSHCAPLSLLLLLLCCRCCSAASLLMVTHLVHFQILRPSGLIGGGGYGLVTGMRDSAGERQRIRVNKVLNATAKRGPGLANSLGCIGALFASEPPHRSHLQACCQGGLSDKCVLLPSPALSCSCSDDGFHFREPRLQHPRHG